MEWNDSYCLGVALIDKQHRELFRAVNRIVSIVDEGDADRNQRACMEAIKYLKNYTLMHFQDEEEYQISVNYQNYEAHKQEHDDFREVILGYEARLAEESFSRDAVLDFLEVLCAWLVNHIQQEDQRIVKDM